ncbi:MAG: hypothetical protein RR641_01145 [Erysipelotrichaceae bacterium]
MEKTKTLKAGDKVDKVPDAKTLESMGLCYEVVYKETRTVYKEKPKTDKISEIIESNKVKKTYEKNYLSDGESVQNVYKYKQGYIIPVNGLFKMDGETTWSKEIVNIKGENWLRDIIFEENIEILKAMFEITE